MKTIEDIVNQATLEVIHAHTRMREIPFSQFYLWYSPSSPDRDGGIVAAQDRPTLDHQLAWNQRIPGDMTPDQFVQFLHARGILASLPILAV